MVLFSRVCVLPLLFISSTMYLPGDLKLVPFKKKKHPKRLCARTESRPLKSQWTQNPELCGSLSGSLVTAPAQRKLNFPDTRRNATVCVDGEAPCEQRCFQCLRPSEG